MISVCSGFDLKRSMQRAEREAELVEDDDEAEVPLSAAQDDPSTLPPPPTDFSPAPTTSIVWNAVRRIINMCRPADLIDSDSSGSGSSTATSTCDDTPAQPPPPSRSLALARPWINRPPRMPPM